MLNIFQIANEMTELHQSEIRGLLIWEHMFTGVLLHMLNLHVQCFFCKTIFSGTHILIFDWRPQYSSSLHKWSPISCRSSVGQGQFAGKIPTFYHCTTQPTNIISNFDKFDDEELKILPKDKYTKEFADFWSKSNCNYFLCPVRCSPVFSCSSERPMFACTMSPCTCSLAPQTVQTVPVYIAYIRLYFNQNKEFLNSQPYYASKKIVIQSSDFPVRCTGSYRHKKKHCACPYITTVGKKPTEISLSRLGLWVRV